MGRIQVTCPDKVSVFRSLMDPVPSHDSASATAASIAPLLSAPGSTRMAGEETTTYSVWKSDRTRPYGN
jgi:hypothetical protein